MATRRTGHSFEPRRYLPNFSHPDYKKELSDYIVGNLLPTRRAKAKADLMLDRPLIEPPSIPAIPPELHHFQKESLISPDGEIILPESIGTFVIQAVKSMGADALDTVSPIVRLWQYQAQSRDLKARRGAIKWLKSLGRALVPDNRGKRGSGSELGAFNVKTFYLRQMFKLYHVRNALQTFPGTRSERVKNASESFEMPVKTIRELWCLDRNDHPEARPVTMREMARMLTARHFKITQHRVSNIIAS